MTEYVKFNIKESTIDNFVGGYGDLYSGVAEKNGDKYGVYLRDKAVPSIVDEETFKEHFIPHDVSLTEKEIYNFYLDRDTHLLKQLAGENRKLKLDIKERNQNPTICRVANSILNSNKRHINKLERSIRVWKYELSKLITLKYLKDNPEHTFGLLLERCMSFSQCRDFVIKQHVYDYYQSLYHKHRLNSEYISPNTNVIFDITFTDLGMILATEKRLIHVYREFTYEYPIRPKYVKTVHDQALNFI